MKNSIVGALGQVWGTQSSRTSEWPFIYGFINIYYCQALWWVLEMMVNKTDKASAPKLGKFWSVCLLTLREGKTYQHYIIHLDNPILGPGKFGLFLSPHLINKIFPPTFLSSMSHRQPTKAVMQLLVAVVAAKLNTLSQTSHLKGQLSTRSKFSGTALLKHRSDLVTPLV